MPRSAPRSRTAAQHRFTTLLFRGDLQRRGRPDRVRGSRHARDLYRHFPSKEALVISYLEGVHDAIAEQITAATTQAHGPQNVRALGEQVVSELGRKGFRGCAFINAASEYENPDSPVRQVIANHRHWYYDTVRRAFDNAGHAHPGNAARHFLMLRDGAMTGGSLGSSTIAKRTFNRGVEGLLRSIDMTPLDPTDDGEQASSA